MKVLQSVASVGLLVLALAVPTRGEDEPGVRYNPGSEEWAERAAREFAIQSGNAALADAIDNGTVNVFVGDTGSDLGAAIKQGPVTNVFCPQSSNAEMVGIIATHEHEHVVQGHNDAPKAGSNPTAVQLRRFFADECAAHEAAASRLISRLMLSYLPFFCDNAGDVVYHGANACALAADLNASLPANPNMNNSIGVLNSYLVELLCWR